MVSHRLNIVLLLTMMTLLSCTPFLSDFGHAESGWKTSGLNESLKFEGGGTVGSLLWLAPEILAGKCS
jgi:hypothetical protein